MPLKTNQIATASDAAVDGLRARGLAEASLERARTLASETGERLALVLIRLGLAPESAVAEAYAAAFDVPLADASAYPALSVVDPLLEVGFLRRHCIVPLECTAACLTVAVADPSDADPLTALRFVAKRRIDVRVGLRSHIERAIEAYAPDGKGGVVRQGVAADTHRQDLERIEDAGSEAPIIRLVDRWIAEATVAGASDIHIEPHDDEVRVCVRVDGVLRDVETVPGHLQAGIVSRIKVMARLNIAERRLAQDGRLRTAVQGRDIDIRVSIMPTVAGESVVLRILDRGTVKLDFTALGFEVATLHRLQSSLERPHGIVLVTGPTGSGKTTTLYTALLGLCDGARKILTVEDPVEYRLKGINQTQVKPDIGLSFASVLRSFLRHDPDILMVGEIRDLETAEIAAQAALTGHLVLSTLHTNDAASAVTRLIDMGLESYLITATVNAIAAQRLVRKLCPQCRTSYRPNSTMVHELGLGDIDGAHDVELFRPAGCPQCKNTGYAGRTVIAEVLHPSDRIADLIAHTGTAREIARVACEEGMETMFRDGLRKALAGLTSVEEVLRVTRSA